VFITGKFTPIQQWLYYDFLDALPDTQLDEEEVSESESRMYT